MNAGGRVPGPPCCDLHGRNCEPPADLCCPNCTETPLGHMQGTLGWADYPPQHARELRDARPAEHTAHLIDDDGVTPIRFVRAGGAYTNAEEITLRPGAVLDLGKGWTVSTHGYPGAMTDDPISMRIVGEPFD